MNNIPDTLIESFVTACREVGRRGLTRCSSGNMSCRVDGERFLVSCSRSWLERLTAEDVSLCRIADASLLEGKRPSVEARFHAGVLRVRPEVNTVLHFQAPCATALACRPAGTVNYDIIPEIPYYLGPVADIPYLTPGSEELAEAVIETMQDHDLVNLNHHGQVTAAANLDQAMENAVFFELACEVLLKGGPEIEPLSPGAIRSLRRAGS